MTKKYNVAVVGATGMVGQKMIQVLQERRFPINRLKLLASARSVDLKIQVGGQEYSVEEAVPASFEGVDFAFFSAGEAVSRELAPEAVKRGAIVIDNSNAFRLEEKVPLVVPEVNPEAAFKHNGLIANPNCSTIQMVVALQPLHRAAGLKRVVAATYQAVSGAGREAVEELFNQCRAVLEGREATCEYIPHKGAARHYQLAFNLVPQLDVFVEDDYTKEEMKMVYETRKIMGIPDLAITATTVRVPVANGHSEVLNIEFQNPITPQEAREVLEKAPGVVVRDDPAQLIYPMPLDADGRDEVYVGRIRRDRSVPYGLNLWVVADNIRKGAATNSIQIAELLLQG
ncbi:MAG TPA: aspartate-semialdehyde dehydrogenase [Bacillota bacterium]|jgi:aspartate-semialdehyde dehydrogenase|nr:aspartate-semialdehyde dehydrogenase [Bacillota bacterium]HOB86773.1 aspartate-semialdehyde dehydrogenase [Bacillota bacterium]HOP69876.1 aspartate-semialdehyde dehydrogenase [Bacillota bacterium]HPT33291.1 aspartate-semialdehyde dehydrogenase [Bacillota bacterium]HQD06000.1 aspartate-semialdehyde dehydrogenase [Bacillota bacterium]